MRKHTATVLPSLILFAALFAATPAAYAQVKYVAVVEVEIDARSGASADLSAAEAQEITAELRRAAVKNLPSGKYNIMTSETVQAQGGAVLEECAEENCVITLGSKIGADYIVRGIIRKFKTLLTLSVEIYETEDGNLVASSDPVRSENAAELLMKTGAACAEMYKTFAATQRSVPKAAVTYTVTAVANPAYGGTVSRKPDQTYYAPGTIVSVTAAPANGYAFMGWSGASTSANATLTAPIDRDLTLTANFQYIQKTYTLTTNVSPQEGGYVSRNPSKKAYTPGETVTLTASPESGYKFTGWTGVAAGRKNSVTVAMDGDKTVTANFYRKSVAAEPQYDGQTVKWGGEREDDEAAAERKPMTGFSLGYSLSKSHDLLQLGVVHSRPMTENVLSLNVESNILLGKAYYGHYADGGSVGVFGFNVPVTALMRWSFFSLEAGLDADLIFGDDETLFNAGFVVGAGIGFGKKHSRRYFYRYCGGYNFGTHVAGMWWLF